MKITVELLKEKKACSEGIEAFEAAYPRGVTYSKPWHKRMLSGQLAEFEWWAVEAAVIPALVDSAGDEGTATAGHRGTANAGHRGTANAGHRGTANTGDFGTAIAGCGGTAAAGRYGTANAGRYGTASAGHRGTATASDEGTANAGNNGTATAGFHGTATAGDYGTATAGECGTASAGHGSELHIRWYDAEAERYRTSTAYVGEDGILPGTKYRLDSEGNFVLAE